MLPRVPVFKLIFLLISVLLLSQCTQISKSAIKNDQSNSSKSFLYAMPAESYLTLAKNQNQEEQNNLLLMAAGRLIEEGKWKKGREILSETMDLNVSQQAEKTILLAAMDLIQQQPKVAIRKLSNVKDIKQLPTPYQLQYLEILAKAYETTGNPIESVQKRIQLEETLPTDSQRADNRQRLWLTLAALPTEEAESLLMESEENNTIQGWLKLALIAKNKDVETNYSQLENWQNQYAMHPANRLLPSPLSAVRPYLQKPPEHIGLLIPLSGPLAGPGSAIRDGFVAAANQAQNGATIRIYDTAKEDVVELYQRAIAQGIDFVVGPLSKSEVSRVAALSHPVPTLLLNDVEIKSLDTNLYRFSLSPVNEAKQVALQARKKGHQRALIIAPKNDWGNEVVASFQTQWSESGGEVIEELRYHGNMDLNSSIRSFLHVEQSEGREKRLKQLLGRNLQVVPSRRQDFDVIFMLAYPSKARQIMPLLRYYFAGDVPVYATSAIYSGSIDVMKDKDLEGITFCDIPWVFNHQTGKRNWPEQLNSYNRLYALGMDSYELTSQFNRLLLFPAVPIATTQDSLYLNWTQQVGRMLTWGQFKGGVAVEIKEVG